MDAIRDLLETPNIFFSIGMIDFDNFKEINDTEGHLMGDSVLSAFFEITRDKLKDTDIVGRFGGEEIVIIFMRTNHRS